MNVYRYTGSGRPGSRSPFIGHIEIPTNLNLEHSNQRRRAELNSLFYTDIGIELKRYRHFAMGYHGGLLSNTPHRLSQLGLSLFPLQTRIVVIGFGVSSSRKLLRCPNGL